MTLKLIPLLWISALTVAGEDRVSSQTIRQVLIDVERNLRVEGWSITSSDVEPAAATQWSVVKDVLHGGRQEGVDRIRVNNGRLSFTIIPTRGMSLWEGRCGDVRLGWDSPVKEVVHPSTIELNDRGGLGWLEGFGEWINRCGLASNGSPGEDRVPSNTGSIVPVNLTLHGKIGNLPARKVEVIVEPGPPAVIRISGEVDEAAMFGTQLRLVTVISTVVGSESLTICDQVRNLAATPQEVELLYHANFGAPLLEEGAEVVAPALRVTPRDARATEGGMESWSRYGAPTPGFVEQVYFLKLAADTAGATEVLLRNRGGTRGVTLSFHARELPCFTVWKNTGALENGYVTGIEPATNYPNHRSFERAHGRVPKIPGGGAISATVKVTVCSDHAAVEEASSRVKALVANHPTQIDAAPKPDLCP